MTGHVETLMSYDLVVLGGGMAGVCCAVAAARQGCRTALVQDRPVLGGNSSSEIRMHICGADCIDDGQARRETGILEEMRLRNLVENPQNSPAMWDLLLYDLVHAEPLLDLYLNTLALEPVMASPTRLAGVRARQLGSERDLILRGTLFADCSGDGAIAAAAGADFHRGREAASEYGESLAGQASDPYSLGSSLLFMARDMGRPMPFEKPEWAYNFPTDDSLDGRPHGEYRYGYWWIEWGGKLDTITDNEAIRDELLKVVLGVWDHIKNHGDHGADHWALEWIGMVPGKRESRRFLGDYVLRQSDLEHGQVFPDTVAYGGWPIDTHPVDGIRAAEAPCRQIIVPIYTIPLRALYSRNIDNLLFAGRNMSATHIAFASTRVMSTCAVMGQAAGVAAALCIEEGLTPRQAAETRIDTVQQRLLAMDCYLPSIRNTDAGDLARQATVRGSSSTPSLPATVIDGISRPDGEGGHYWESDALAAGDAWLELTWPAPCLVDRIHLIFDSELERRLIFTQETHIYAWSHVLTSLPERLVKDFSLEYLSEGEWEPLCTVTGNRLRHRVECFDPVRARAVRLKIAATHGAPTARVFEIRAYGPPT